MTRSLFALGWVVVISMVELTGSLRATELRVPSALNYGVGAPLYCGLCGCLVVAYTYHPELRSTYGLGFDPRNYDTTEPRYYFGRMRAYPQYYIDGLPAHGTC